MANNNAPFGLRPRKYLNGAPYNGQCREYFVTGSVGAIFIGDPVMLAGSANTAEFAGNQPGSLATVIPALDGDADPIVGVCVGVKAVTRDSVPYREDSTDRIIEVADDPNIIFEVQADAGGTALAATDVGAYAVLQAAAGSTVTGMSGWALDTAVTAVNNDPSYQLQIMGFSNDVRNEIGAYARVEVIINNHAYAQAADAGRATAA